MSYNIEQIRGNDPNSTNEITVTLSNSAHLGYAAINGSGQQMAASGNYDTTSPDNYYIFFAGNTQLSDTVTVSGDTITINDKGTYHLKCCPSFGLHTGGSLGNNYIRMQFVDADDVGFGNKGTAQRNYEATHPATPLFSGRIEGPTSVKLKILDISSSTHFPKNITDSGASQFFLSIIRLK